MILIVIPSGDEDRFPQHDRGRGIYQTLVTCVENRRGGGCTFVLFCFSTIVPVIHDSVHNTKVTFSMVIVAFGVAFGVGIKMNYHVLGTDNRDFLKR